MTTDREELLAAVHGSREELGVPLDDLLLDAIIDIEMSHPDRDAAERAILQSIISSSEIEASEASGLT